MLKYLTSISLLFLILTNCSNIKNQHEIKQVALINDVSFHNSNFGNNNAGNGFIVNVKGIDYAITAKHVLMIVKTDKMKSIGFSGELKQWKMFDKNNTSIYLVVDKLINANDKQKLDWDSAMKDDRLVFSIKENNTKYKPLKIRQKPLIKGEKLFIVGWAYENKEGPQRIYQFGFDKTEDNSHTLIQLKGPKSLAGLSGAPIVDKQNNLVGLVSTGWQDEETKTTYLQASQASDIHRFIVHYMKK